ncbi:transglycosylase SLT domain-containing protein [Ponticoccus sp. SC2-23]|uniref:transglycosylase SLT domain-containing protein n=1 Tax=Alexandriicola marinus TaxID=2081710 RepID=UPI000FD9E55F|nr:transglycosylase SLT domain-containing protein [Alexandriicola marinus]MBM1220559.1 transglycosylase SLT domain-containing protein [Ponticoccus sp. SC6-9]MBM1225245.1 transglycosylase SLT domain-containing protein [Ponticoccus sp. SC6-15]MBM1228759.1 transglycosylase SLT domain-containing protein [Ponticoccus sp. SC6-38]MBM1233604.1 transglycosylase SLT domain-containing protein [Ponticoccus sp. SC6-45]MBM1239260.1 transglycosylase SLT domain-containing protein [Ponticoccus sp. SC6-49]MBM1
MSRLFRAAILMLLLASCGSGNYSAPRGLDDACSIVDERPSYLRAFRAAERKWGVPVNVQMAIMYQESKFVANARPPHRYALGVIPWGRQSTAYGYSQALDATWQEYQDAEGGSRARRDSIRDASDFMGWYMAETTERLGIAIDDTRRQYLAYHEGRTGYARGSYNRKSWLLRIAGELEGRAQMYKAQLISCGKM